MNQRGREFAQGTRHFAEVLACLAAGALLGATLASWQAPGSEFALVASVLLFPATVLLGWMLLFPLAVLMLPLAVPRFLRWLREPLPPAPIRGQRPPPQATAAGWVFVAAALPTSLVAGLLAGAPLTYLLAGLLYGYGLRHSAALQDVTLQ